MKEGFDIIERKLREKSKNAEVQCPPISIERIEKGKIRYIVSEHIVPETKEKMKLYHLIFQLNDDERHKAAINETARLTDEKQILSEDVIAKLNEQLNLIKENIGTNPIVTITYFVPDDKKSGGAYISYTGVVKKIDEYNRTVVLTDKTVIPIEQISEMQSDIFSEIY